jgi:hypothetical protein
MATTLLTLIGRCSRRFDDTSESFIDATTEWPELINEALAALHNELVSAGEGYLQTETTLTLVDGQVKYDLPADFFKLVGAFLVSSGDYIPLQRFMTKTFRGGSSSVPAGPWTPTLRYDVRGSTTGPKVWFDPTPNGDAPNTIAVWYIPTFVALASTSDTLPAWLPAGWEEFIVNYAVTRARIKEQSASSEDLNVLLGQMQERITREAVNRDLMNPQRVVSVGDFDGWPY